MDAATRELVRRRAGNRCEYCLHPQEHTETTHHIEHIVARQHLGTDDPLNLALACIHCNSHKGPNLTGIDPDSGMIVPLFSPRQERWADHFALRASYHRRANRPWVSRQHSLLAADHAVDENGGQGDHVQGSDGGHDPRDDTDHGSMGGDSRLVQEDRQHEADGDGQYDGEENTKKQ